MLILLILGLIFFLIQNKNLSKLAILTIQGNASEFQEIWESISGKKFWSVETLPRNHGSYLSTIEISEAYFNPFQSDIIMYSKLLQYPHISRWS